MYWIAYEYIYLHKLIRWFIFSLAVSIMPKLNATVAAEEGVEIGDDISSELRFDDDVLRLQTITNE